jgi:hypothetical protein
MTEKCANPETARVFGQEVREGGNMKQREWARTFAAVLVMLSGAGQAWALMMPIPESDLAQRSDVIVTGTVASLKSYWNADRSLIHTDVTIQPEEFVKGRADRGVVVRTLGGEVGDMRLIVEDQPAFSLGERVTVNLTRLADGAVFEVLGGYQGKSLALGGPKPPPPPLDSYFDCSGNRRELPACGYYVNQLLLDKGWKDALGRAGDSWSLAGSAFRFNCLGPTNARGRSFDGINTISDSDFGASSSYWAICYIMLRRKFIVENDIVFNTRPTWYTYPEPYCPGDGGDVQNIGCHEMGHCLQLLDLPESYQSEQTMFWAASFGETKKRSLADGDKRGIKYIYGSWLLRGGNRASPPVAKD